MSKETYNSITARYRLRLFRPKWCSSICRSKSTLRKNFLPQAGQLHSTCCLTCRSRSLLRKNSFPQAWQLWFFTLKWTARMCLFIIGLRFFPLNSRSQRRHLSHRSLSRSNVSMYSSESRGMEYTGIAHLLLLRKAKIYIVLLQDHQVFMQNNLAEVPHKINSHH